MSFFKSRFRLGAHAAAGFGLGFGIFVVAITLEALGEKRSSSKVKTPAAEAKAHH